MKYFALALFAVALLGINQDAEAARRRTIRKTVKAPVKGVCKVVNGIRVCR